jgi:hypothetical protein
MLNSENTLKLKKTYMSNTKKSGESEGHKKMNNEALKIIDTNDFNSMYNQYHLRLNKSNVQ